MSEPSKFNPYAYFVEKNRRVLGFQTKSMSFRTHEKNPIVHKQFQFQLKKVSYLTCAARLFLFGDVKIMNVISQSAQKIMAYDMKQLEEIVRIHYNLEKEKKINWFSVDPQILSDYFTSFNYIGSFLLKEYEKQLFYIKALQYYRPVELMRYIYHSEPINIDFDSIDEIIAHQLVFGVDIDEFCKQKITWSNIDILNS